MATKKDQYTIEEIPDVKIEKPIREGQIDDKEVTDDKIRNVSFGKLLSGKIRNKLLELLNSTFIFINSKLQFKDEENSTYTTDFEEKSDGLNLDLANTLVLSNKFGVGFVIVPKVNGVYDIGAAIKAFKNIYATENVVIGGKNAVKSGNNPNGSYTLSGTFTTSTNGGLDPHNHTVNVSFTIFTTTMIKDGVEYYVLRV